MENRLVIIGAVWPEPTSTAAGRRMLQLISLVQMMDFSVSFLCAAAKSEYSFNLSSMDVDEIPIELNSDSFDILIKKLDPSIVVFDRYMIEEQFGWRVIENCPKAIRILDTEDLHFLRKARHSAFVQNRTIVTEDYINDIFVREMAAIYRCDLSLIISEFEYGLLMDHFGMDSSIIHYLPFLENNYEKCYDDSFDKRQHFVSIGNFFHEPNWQTVLQLKKLWPEIKGQLPLAEVHIYGAYPPPKAYQLEDIKGGFIIKGRADSVKDIFSKYRVLLAPIPFGAGLKGKLLESMLYGLPNVTTSMGAEGMTWDNLWNGFVSDFTQFAQKSIELYEVEAVWKESQKKGYQIIENKFYKSLHTESFNNVVKKLLHGLESHRTKNFLGKIFTQETLMSKRYLSKWIEEKNRI